MLIRPVRLEDHKELLGLAQQAGIGMMSLPPDAPTLEKKIQNSINSFNGKPAKPAEENFLWVMEDTENNRLVGTTGILAHVGLSRPFYNYKITTIVQANKDYGVYSHHRVLNMVNDYTGSTEMCSLFLLPDYRRDGLGAFLSRCRFLMLAEFPKLFADVVIAEIRGVSDGKGGAPFYDSLAKHFFHMTFEEADSNSAIRGNQFIADLMPKYPIYVNLLPESAREVIGQPLEASRPAMMMLQNQGFTFQGYVDIFDAGPTVEAERSKIKTVERSKKAKISQVVDAWNGSEKHMISTTQLPDFYICRDMLETAEDGTAIITRNTAEKLKVEVGDAIRYAPA